MKTLKNKKDKERKWWHDEWTESDCGRPEEWAQDRPWTKGTNTRLGPKTARVWMGRERGWVGLDCCKPSFWGGAIPQHTRGASQRSEVTSLLNALNIGGLIGSVEKGDPDGQHMHTRTQNQPPTLPKWSGSGRKWEKAADSSGLTVNQHFSRWPKRVGQNSPIKLGLSKDPFGFSFLINA